MVGPGDIWSSGNLCQSEMGNDTLSPCPGEGFRRRSLTQESLDPYTTVNEVFERCCRFTGAHKQPLETLNVRPSLTKLEEDWNALQAIHSQFSK